MSSWAAGRSFLSLTLSCFAAGIAVGLAVPMITSAVGAEQDSDAEFVEQLRDRYDLSRDQVRQIRMVLAKERSEHLAILSEVPELPPAIKQRVLEVKRRAEERIKYVLTPEQRQRFLRDAELDGDHPDRGRQPEDSSGKE